MDSKKDVTIRNALKTASSAMREAGIENPRLNAERMLGHQLDLSRSDLYLHPEKCLSHEEEKAYETLIQRRLQKEPLQYIIGETEPILP